MKDLPIELLRTFLAVVDGGSMARAARSVDRTPSAVSLQMSRLAALAGRPLFRRDGRGQALTPAGETLARHAREILDATDRAKAALSSAALEGPVRLGIVQDLADTLLPRALAEFAATNPGVRLHVQVGSSAPLLDEAQAGGLDFVACFASRRAPRAIRREPLVWLGHPSLAAVDPLPLAVLVPACPLCEAGARALERAGRRHEIVLRTPSLSGLRAALEAGLAVACRTPLLRAGTIEILGAAERLPPLEDVAFALHVPRPLGPAARKLAGVVRQVIAGETRAPTARLAG